MRGRWLVLLRAAWAVIVTFYMAVYLFSIPLQIEFYQSACPDLDACSNNQATIAQMARLREAGLSAAFYGYFTTIVITLYEGLALAQVLIVIELVSIPVLFIYRYVQVFDTVRRLQTKWVVFGSSVALFGLAGLLGLLATRPDGAIAGQAFLAMRVGMFAFLLLIPISIGMAILRSHLWDIDIIIRRTLIYALLTAVLALVYGGSVVVSQGILRAAVGESGSSLATVLSTLAIAALFQPLRRRIQTGIDRRFYRSKYDAALVLGAFGTAVRDEVDLPRLADHLAAAVDEAMQPAHVSLWLTRADRRLETRD